MGSPAHGPARAGAPSHTGEAMRPSAGPTPTVPGRLHGPTYAWEAGASGLQDSVLRWNLLEEKECLIPLRNQGQETSCAESHRRLLPVPSLSPHRPPPAPREALGERRLGLDRFAIRTPGIPRRARPSPAPAPPTTGRITKLPHSDTSIYSAALFLAYFQGKFSLKSCLESQTKAFSFLSGSDP